MKEGDYLYRVHDDYGRAPKLYRVKIVKVTDKRVDIGTLAGLEFKCRRFIPLVDIGTFSGEAYEAWKRTAKRKAAQFEEKARTIRLHLTKPVPLDWEGGE